MPGHFVMCRLCMKKSSRSTMMENVFHGEAVTVETIRIVTQIEVVEGDGLPQHVCLFCILSLNSAKNFIQTCIECNKKLKLQSMVRASKLRTSDKIKKNFSPVVQSTASLLRRPKTECPSPDITEFAARRLELGNDFQDNMDQDLLETNIKEENENLDETDSAEITIPELEVENDVNKQDVRNALVELTQASGSSVLNTKEHRAFQGSSPKQDNHKRQRSPSTHKQSPGLIPEDEPELDEDAEVLSWYDSDLNLVIDKANFLSAAPVHINAFGYMWAGARAAFGFADGKLAFQTKIEEDLDVSHLGKEPCPNVVRVGWSVSNTTLQLGEGPRSYGFCGTGKAFTDCKFKDYGVPFKVGDIVTSYLEWTEEHAVLTFAVNGETQGEAYRVLRKKLDGQPLFPHVLSKNQRFSVDFGAREEPWFPLDEGFVFVGAASVESRVAGPRRPEKKEDCEIVMMCGLPGAGKTTWVNQYVAGVPEKQYNVLGTNALIDKMRVDGLPRKGNCEGRWEHLIEKCTRCLLKLMEVAAGRRRNYILDQTNVYLAGQQRKMRLFEGFVRRAIVIVPTDDEFKLRLAKHEVVKGKFSPNKTMLEMKANFALPKEGDVFSEVIFIELEHKETQVLVEQYNKEGRTAGYSSQNNKKPRNASSGSQDILDGSLQGREYRVKSGRGISNQRSRGGGLQQRGRSRGGRRGLSNDRRMRGDSGGNSSGANYNRWCSQAGSDQNTTGYQGGVGYWNNGAWNAGYNQQQQQQGGGGQQVWDNYYRQQDQQGGTFRHAQNNYYNQLEGVYSQQGVYGQQGWWNPLSSNLQQTGYYNVNYNWNK